MRTMLMLTALWGLAAPAMAQQDTLIGYRVWLREEGESARDGGVKGLVVRVRGDTLLLRSEGYDTLVPVWPRARTRLMVYQGRKSRQLVGSVIGFGVGASIGAIVGSTTEVDEDGGRASAIIISTMLIGVVSSWIGWGIGRLTRRDAWKRDRKFVPARVTVTSLPGGRAGIGFSITTP